MNEVMEGHKMVRRGDPTCIQGETPIQFLNKIQKVAYELNPFIVGVAERLQERQIEVGKFIPVISLDLPPKPVDIAENKESRKDYCRRAAEVMNVNAQAFGRSCRTRMTMNAVKIFKKHKKFYCPYSADYRGRVYPIPAFLTPQDTDFGKSLIRFHDEAFVTPEAEQWLAFQVATTYGLDKATMQERLEWTAANHPLITAIATNPDDNLGDWEGADEPWQFLAACEEYHACVIACTRQFTKLMVATDATCSGLQILAGLARDESTAKLVNVIPGDKPQDAYKVIAEHAKPNVPDCVKPHMDRKVTKRTVMTIPYNAKPFSNRGYIRDALREKGFEIEKDDDLTATVKAVRDAMEVVVPGPMKVMKWIESEVAAAIDRGEQQIRWVTPSGFVVTQRLMKRKLKHIELQLLGRCKVSISTEEEEKVDKAHHKNATAPNLIHSLDASLLALSTIRFNAPVALIHDSVLCRATDMGVLSSIVRETYMHLFAEHDYLKTFAMQIGAETEPPIIGDLEPSRVIDSTYFFLLMKKIIKTPEPVVLDGFQAILQVSQFGKFQLEAILDDTIIDVLEADRPAALDWAASKQKKRDYKTNDEPWKPVSEGKYKTRFTWGDDAKPVIVDTEGTVIEDDTLPLYNGSKVKLAFYQKPYSLPTGTIGTRLVMEAIQVVALAGSAGVDIGDADETDPAAMFGKTEGFKLGDPNVVSDVSNDAALEDDF